MQVSFYPELRQWWIKEAMEIQDSRGKSVIRKSLQEAMIFCQFFGSFFFAALMTF